MDVMQAGGEGPQPGPDTEMWVSVIGAGRCSTLTQNVQ